MRKEFLRSVAEVYVREMGDRIADFCFVFPNRRASVFFMHYLGESAGRPVFSPELTTINDFVISLGSLRPADRLTCLYRLYMSFKACLPDYQEPFDDFVHVGEMFLNDFDDIDKYMADAGKVFTNIRDLKEIRDGYEYLSLSQRKALSDFWGVVIDSPKGEKERSFLSLWENLYGIYTHFRNSLRSTGEGYEGMIYREVAERLLSGDGLPASLSGYSGVVFVGMNALNECERVLLDTLRDASKADFYWDYYGGIIRDRDNRASFFMETNISSYPSRFPLPEDGGLPDRYPEITVIGVPSLTGQAMYAGKILSGKPGLSDERDGISTAVVLPDGQLLFPLLNSLPETVGQVNVTMGCPLSGSLSSSFMRLVEALHAKSRVTDSGLSFYYRSVQDLLSHPFVRRVAESGCREVLSEMVKTNSVYVNSRRFSEYAPLGLLFSACGDMDLRYAPAAAYASYLSAVIDEFSSRADDVDKEFMLEYFKCVNRIGDLPLTMRRDTFFRLLSVLSSSVTVPFEGEPLAGLQVMGPLETRAVDFRTLIILSCNEGVFPSSSVSNSFIPYNVRKGFGLPTYEHSESVSAYYFYRSLCRAEKVYMLYDTRTGSGPASEVSRYVRQLEYHHGLDIKKLYVAASMGKERAGRISVEKTADCMERLGSLRFSPSAITAYLNCPLSFYYRYVERLEEEDDVVESVDARLFGTLFHKAMELLYSPLTGVTITGGGMLSGLVSSGKAEAAIMSAFREVMHKERISGRFLIIKELLRRYIEKTVMADAACPPSRILATERTYTASLDIGGCRVSLKGIIDRVDDIGGKTRIVDYKTGRASFAYKDVSDFFSRERHGSVSVAMQLFFYLFLATNSALSAEAENTLVSVYSLRDIFRASPAVHGISPGELEDFRSQLVAFFNELMNPALPFTGCEDRDRCVDCPYNILCNR